jgi:hypothetical protein
MEGVWEGLKMSPLSIAVRKPAAVVLAAVGLIAPWLIARGVRAAAGGDPPELKPFGPAAGASERKDAVPGYIELSDGTIRVGRIFLTRDARLRIFDARTERQRDVPLQTVRRLDCTIQREWLEPEWRFKENANDEKIFTGRSYPAREYRHAITLSDGRKLEGPLSALVYVAPENGGEPEKFLLHKRDKGPVGTTLASLVYVRSIRLGDEALSEGKTRAAARRSTKTKE